MKINFKRIAKRLTGISTPFFGVSWTPPDTHREVARKLITFLEDRRALYNPYDMETPVWVIESVLEIRRRLTETLGALDEDADISPHLRAMRAACRKFMDEAERLKRGRYSHFGGLFVALGEMRAIFGVHIAQLSVKYGVNIDGKLTTILPGEDAERRRPKTKRGGS